MGKARERGKQICALPLGRSHLAISLVGSHTAPKVCFTSLKISWTKSFDFHFNPFSSITNGNYVFIFAQRAFSLNHAKFISIMLNCIFKNIFLVFKNRTYLRSPCSYSSHGFSFNLFLHFCFILNFRPKTWINDFASKLETKDDIS